MFKTIKTIDDVRSAVADKKEIRFSTDAAGITIGCYLFMDGRTFDTPEALDCRGIAFDSNGDLVSRPLHKFFNMGEKPWLLPERLLDRAARDQVVGIYEKLDGSMISTAWIGGELHWRSKKSFTSDVVRLAKQFLALPENAYIEDFARAVASSGHTAIFELRHPLARIVVEQAEPDLRLLHIRENASGAYVLTDSSHYFWRVIEDSGIPVVHSFELSLQEAIDSLETMTECEGYVVQFSNGDMCKLKSAWYRRLHRSITFLRERNIAELALTEQLDDVKAALVEAGVDLTAVLEVETRVKDALVAISEQLEHAYEADKTLDRKSYAIKHTGHPLFGLLMSRYIGKDLDIPEWYRKHRLRDEFSLRVLANDAQAEAIE